MVIAGRHWRCSETQPGETILFSSERAGRQLGERACRNIWVFVGRQQGETAGRDSWERLLGDSWEGQLGQLEDSWKGQLGEIARRYLG